jgi:hypothetical protein
METPALLNGLGAATGIVAIVQVTTKFTHGAWIVVSSSH